MTVPFNPAAQPYGLTLKMTPLARSFYDTNSLHGSRTALWVDEQSYTYNELSDTALKLASAFPETKANVQTPSCAIFAHRSAVAYLGILACHLARHAYIALTPIHPIERLRTVLEQSRPTTLIADKRCLPLLPGLLANYTESLIIVLPDQSTTPEWAIQFPQHSFSIRTDLRDEIKPSDGSATDLAYLMYTSGSTGGPKGVMVSHDNVMSYVSSAVQYFDYVPEDRFIHLPELNFDLSVHDLFCAWAVGASLYCVPQDEVLMPDRFVARHQLTAWTSVPSAAALLKRFNKLRPGTFPSLRASMFCGEPFPGALAADWMAAAPNSRVANLYGPTETTVAVTAYSCSRGTDFAILPLGDPFAGQEVIICDEHLNPVKDGDIGELLLGGTQVSVGYWKRSDLTDEQFIERSFPPKSARRWYRTGDLASLEPGSGLTYRGRATRQIKIRGYRVELAEIEATLRKGSGQEFVAAIPILGSDKETLYISAFVEQLHEGDVESLRRECERLLPSYMVPKYIFSVVQMPLNQNGKIDYQALEKLNREQIKNI